MPLQEFHHVTPDGRSIPLRSLSDEELDEAIETIFRAAQDGVPVRHLRPEWQAIYHIDTTLFDDQALHVMYWQMYINEQDRRRGVGRPRADDVIAVEQDRLGQFEAAVDAVVPLQVWERR